MDVRSATSVRVNGEGRNIPSLMSDPSTPKKIQWVLRVSFTSNAFQLPSSYIDISVGRCLGLRAVKRSY